MTTVRYLALAALVAVAACGSGGGDDTTAPSPTATPAAAATPTETATPVPGARAFLVGSTDEEPIPGLFEGVVLRSDDRGRSWTEVARFTRPVLAVDFVDRETGWIGAQINISGSTDGGQSWTGAIGRTSVYNDLVALPADRVVAVGRIVDFSDRSAEVVARPDGVNWETAVVVPSESPVFARGDLHFVCFIGEGLGIVVGSVDDTGALVLLRDFGRTATDISVRLPSTALTSGACAGERDFWVVGPDTTILHSGDAGTTWEDRRDQLTPVFQGDLVAADFVDRDNGWIAGTPAGGPPRPALLRTVDAGATWQAQVLPDLRGRPIDSLDFLPSGAGLLAVDEIVGPGETRRVILVTSDFGATWERGELPPLRTIEDVTLVE